MFNILRSCLYFDVFLGHVIFFRSALAHPIALLSCVCLFAWISLYDFMMGILPPELKWFMNKDPKYKLNLSSPNDPTAGHPCFSLSMKDYLDSHVNHLGTCNFLQGSHFKYFKCTPALSHKPMTFWTSQSMHLALGNSHASLSLWWWVSQILKQWLLSYTSFMSFIA